MQQTQSPKAGERTHYKVISNADGRIVAGTRHYADAKAWAASPLTKGAYPAGVTVVPSMQGQPQPPPKPSLEKIAQRAARHNLNEDYQVAQNEAYAAALDAGYSEEDASACAVDAGTWHGDYRDNEGMPIDE